MSDGTSLEALQWRHMIQRVFGEDLTPIAAEGRIEQLKALAGPGRPCSTCHRMKPAPGVPLGPGRHVEYCPRCDGVV